MLKRMMNGPTQSGIVAFFKDDHVLLDAAKKTYAAGYRKFDTISPFAIHGMDDAMGLKRSTLPWVTFVFGLVGCVFAVWFQWWTAAVNWPLNIGGKPMFSLPAFVPVIFEMTVLLAGLATFGAMFAYNKLPQVDPPILDPDLTSHKFALWIPSSDVGFDEAKAESHCKSLGAEEVRKVAEF